MTRLKSNQILFLPEELREYDKELQSKIGCGLYKFGNHVINTEYEIDYLNQYKVAVIPVTVGQGLIKGFSNSVASIGEFLGFNTFVTNNTDVKGLKEAYSRDADIIFMADDQAFIALNIKKNKCINNSRATAKAYVSALELMVNGFDDRSVFVLGLGYVGAACVELLISKGAKVVAYDIDITRVKNILAEYNSVNYVAAPTDGVKNNNLIIEATPSKNVISEEYINKNTYIAAPGVPLGLTKLALEKTNNRLIHDFLQLGVTAMAFEVL